MRAKVARLIVTFPTTVAALAMEAACAAAGLPGRLIPVPVEISAGCGMAWSAPPEARAELERFVLERELRVGGWYELAV